MDSRIGARHPRSIGKSNYRNPSFELRPETEQAVNAPEAAGVLAAAELPLRVADGEFPIGDYAPTIEFKHGHCLAEHRLDRIPPEPRDLPNRSWHHRSLAAAPGAMLRRLVCHDDRTGGGEHAADAVAHRQLGARHLGRGDAAHLPHAFL